MIKKLLIFFVILFINKLNSQIIFTEVYYDTPFLENIYHFSDQNESNPSDFHHHWGEYIELYNYSNEDISLKDWAIADRVSKYTFPNNAILKSGKFLVVAYKEISEPNYFTNFYPTTIGKETQIFYQDKVILRNEREDLRLYIGNLRGNQIKNKKSDFVSWRTSSYGIYVGSENEVLNQWDVNSENYNNFNFYVNSLQLSNYNPPSNSIYLPQIANPLTSNYLPTIRPFETIPSVKDAMLTNAAYNTWEYYSNRILNNTCLVNIPIVSQTTSEIFLQTGKCFNYDNSGNNINAIDCTPPPINNIQNPTNEYSQAQIDDINSKIILSPNPTISDVTASWDNSILGKINQIQVANTSGVSLFTLNITLSQSSELIILGSQPTGIYIVKFLLDSGQFINRNVIKI
jgi:Lamin Tail Domain